jgi:flavin-dependent dehydrogenase
MFVGRRGYCGLAPLEGGLTTVAAAVFLDPGGGRTPAERLVRLIAEYPELQQRVEHAARAKPVRGLGPLAWRVPRVAGPGFLLVGDAAGFFDPLTGEGIFRALRGAELAAEAGQAGLSDGNWAAMTERYARLRHAAFADKERLARLIQQFVVRPWLLEYALARLERRPELAQPLTAALGDFGPASVPLQPAFLIRLLRP